MPNIPDHRPNVPPCSAHNHGLVLSGLGPASTAPALQPEPYRRSAVARWLSPRPFTEGLDMAGVAHASGDFRAAYDNRLEAVQTLQDQGPPKGTSLRYHPAFACSFAALAFAARHLYPHRIDALALLSASAVSAIKEDIGRLRESGDVRNFHYSTLRDGLAPTRLHAGVLAALLAVRQEVSGEASADKQWQVARGFINNAWKGSASTRPEYTGRVDQTHINTAPRKAVIDGFSGKPMRGLGVALKGVMLAPLSESPKWTQNSTPGLDRHGRLRAKAKTLMGSMAAGAICMLNTKAALALGGRPAALRLYARMETSDVRVPYLELEPKHRKTD